MTRSKRWFTLAAVALVASATGTLPTQAAPPAPISAVLSIPATSSSPGVVVRGSGTVPVRVHASVTTKGKSTSASASVEAVHPLTKTAGALANPRAAIHAAALAAGLTNREAEEMIKSWGGTYDATAAAQGVSSPAPMARVAATTSLRTATDSVGCSSGVPYETTFLRFATGKNGLDGTMSDGFLDCINYKSSAYDWWMVDKSTTTFGSYSLSPGSAYDSVHHPRGNSTAEWQPYQQVQADNGCKTSSLNLTKTALDVGLSYVVCDGRQIVLNDGPWWTTYDIANGGGWIQNCGFRDLLIFYTCYAGPNKQYGYQHEAYNHSPAGTNYTTVIYATLNTEPDS